GRITGYFRFFAEAGTGAAFEAGIGVGGEDGIDEERAVAAGVGVGGVDDHALAAADGDDGVADAREVAAVDALLVDVAGQFRVTDVGGAVAVQAVGDGEDDVAIGFAGLEAAGAVAEGAVVVGEPDHPAG